LFEQTYDNIEYIFVDDCSPDNSIDELKQVLSKYANRREQTKIIKHHENRGLAAARNTGIENATGDFIMHVDSDDWLATDAVEILVKRQKECNADVIEFDFTVYTRYGSEEYKTIPNCNNKEDHILGVFLDRVMHGVVFRFIRKDLYKQYGLHNIEGANVGEDLYIVPQLLWYANRIDSLHANLYYYDNTNNSSYTGALSEQFVKQLRINQDGLSIFFKDKSQILYDAVEACKLMTTTKNLARLARVGGNEMLFKKVQSDINNYDKRFYDYISIPYRPFLYVRSYRILRIYTTLFAPIKHFLSKHS